MEKKNVFCLLTVAILLLIGTRTYAQENLGDKYAWRLDSIVYNNYLSNYGDMHPMEYNRVYYTYDADGFSEINAQIEFFPKGMYGDYYQQEDMYYRYNRYCGKYAYSDFGADGQHTMYVYAYKYDGRRWTENVDSALSISELLQFDPDSFVLSQRYDYAYDTYRNIFDEDGNLVRQIRNYDFSRYSLDSLGNWRPLSRTERRETDSTLFSRQYYFNINEQQWKNSYSTYGRSYYRNHRLWKQEKMWEDLDGQVESGTEYNVNGGVVRKYSGTGTFGSETYYSSERVIGKASWTTPSDRITVKTTEMYIDDVFTRKTVTSKERDEEYLVEKTASGSKEYPQYVRSWKYNAENVLTAYSNSVYSYDANNHCTLRLDTTLANGAWTIKRTEYDEQGKIVYEKTQEKRTAIDEWITLSEKTSDYTLTTTVQWNANPIYRFFDKKYKYGFDNEYYIRESWNTELQKWVTDNSYCHYTQVNRGENGEPITSISYDELNNGVWRYGVMYNFNYNSDLKAYERIPFAQIGGGNNPYAYELSDYYKKIRWFYSTDGEYIGYFNSQTTQGDFIVYRKDAYNRTTEQIKYAIDINYQLLDTLQWITYSYFPNDTTSDFARLTEMDKDTAAGTWTLYNDIKYTKNYSTYSKEGILLRVDTYGWSEDEIALTQTMKHNDLMYDEQGRIKERITYYTANIGYNVPNTRYVYYYRDDTDPQWYAMIQWGSYNFSNDHTWSSRHVPVYNDYTVQDKLGRVIERIGYTMNSDNTTIQPSTRSVYYYAGDAEDWRTADNYAMNNNGEWRCSGVSINGYTQQAEMDEAGNVLSLTTLGGTCEQGVGDLKNWSYMYGADLSDEPVLSPAAYNMTEERVNNTRPDFSPVASRRVKQIKYSDFANIYKNYTADYFYTALRDGVVNDKMPVTIASERTSAVFTWGAIEGAETYVLHVYADAAQAEEICYVVFDKTGRVLSINFVRHAPARYAEVEQLSYTLDGLTPATDYWYSVQGIAVDGKAIESTSGSFRTEGESEPNTPTGINNAQSDNVQYTKVLRDGQLYLMYKETMYNVQGKRIQ